MFYSLLKRFYQWFPLSPASRFRIGHFKRRLVQRFNPGQRVVDLPQLLAERSTTQDCVDPPGSKLRTYFFFGVIDWHFRHQRPQQLALSIAKAGHKVFYVSVNFEDSADPGFSLERLDPNLALFQVFFKVQGSLSIYSQLPTQAQFQQLRDGLRQLWDSSDTIWAVHILQHPFWYRLASFVPAARVVYDCMDYHAGFSNTAKEHDAVEQKMLAGADLTIVTSSFLADYARATARHVEIIRNAAEFEHFNAACRPRQGPQNKRPVIGYYGAIAEWFDADLVAALAAHFTNCDVQLVGSDTAGVGTHLKQYANVQLFGEKPYAELPQWLADFDVCLIPFKVNQLTLATNPVKIYEYLSAGKPVVSVDLPELRQFGDLVYRAAQTEGFMEQVQLALNEAKQAGAADLCQRRIDFVRQQTWEKRAVALVQAAQDTRDEPLVSVVVVSFNQWHLTQRCLESLEANSDSQTLEIIVVDNASKDETPTRLAQWAQQCPARRSTVLNTDNRGFGPAVNQGLKAARGAYLVIMNNDTMVSPGWARGLRRHFESDPMLGVICPFTNNIGNEAQVALAGSTTDQVFASARRYAMGKTGQTLPLSIAAFFCVMLSRAVYERVGGLDERFVPGFFEDDDYCLRVKESGWTIACAEDVFVYHELSASFDREGAVRRQAIFERNKILFEEKWGAWKPHVYRPESLPG